MVKPFYLRHLEREHARLSAYLLRLRAQTKRWFVRELYYRYGIRSRVERERIAERLVDAVFRAVRRGDLEFVRTRITGIPDRDKRRIARELLKRYVTEYRDDIARIMDLLDSLRRVSEEEALWRRYGDQILQMWFVMFSASRAKRGVEWIRAQAEKRGIPDEVIDYALRWWSQYWGYRHYSFTTLDVYEACALMEQFKEVLPGSKWRINAVICSDYGIPSRGTGRKSDCVTERVWEGNVDDFECEGLVREVERAVEDAARACGCDVYLAALHIHAGL